MDIEAKLTAAERKALPDDAFGLPKLRKYPLITKDENGNDDWSQLSCSDDVFSTAPSIHWHGAPAAGPAARRRQHGGAAARGGGSRPEAPLRRGGAADQRNAAHGGP